MRVERKLEAPPPPVSPERVQNRPAPPEKPEDTTRTADKARVEKPPEKPPEKPRNLGRNLDVKA